MPTTSVVRWMLPSPKLKGKFFLFVLLGTSILVFCQNLFLLRATATTTLVSNSQVEKSSPELQWRANYSKKQQQHQQYQQLEKRQELPSLSLKHKQEKGNEAVRAMSSLMALESFQQQQASVSRRLERRKSRISQQQQHGDSNSGAFVHIGKTGGSTISKLLRNGCHSIYPKPCHNVTNETIVSKLVGDYYHVPDFWKLPFSRHSFYVVSIRDPYDRTVSAFVYGHPKNIRARGEFASLANLTVLGTRIAYRCFPTLEKFVDHLGDEGAAVSQHDFYYPFHSDYLDSRNCTLLAKAAIHNKVRFFSHLYFDIEDIVNKIPNATHPKIYVIRQEHLWDDWKKVNRLLGQTSEVVIPQTKLRNVATVEQPIKRTLSDQGRSRLCRALQGEYDAYVRLLTSAANMNDDDIKSALTYARKQCPTLRIG